MSNMPRGVNKEELFINLVVVQISSLCFKHRSVFHCMDDKNIQLAFMIEGIFSDSETGIPGKRVRVLPTTVN